MNQQRNRFVNHVPGRYQFSKLGRFGDRYERLIHMDESCYQCAKQAALKAGTPVVFKDTLAGQMLHYHCDQHKDSHGT